MATSCDKEANASHAEVADSSIVALVLIIRLLVLILPAYPVFFLLGCDFSLES